MNMETPSLCNCCNREVGKLMVLTCSHTICYKCFYTLFLYNYKSLLCEFKEEASLKCIKCRQGKINIKRKTIFEICSKFIFDNPDNKLRTTCQVHNKEEEVYCRECRAPMCTTCFDHHKIIPLLSSHQAIKVPDHFFNNVCSKHNLQYIYQCLKCEVPMCEKCKTADHEGHSKQFIRDYYEEKREYLLNNIRLPFKTFEELDHHLTEEDKLIKDSVDKQCTILVDKIQSVIEALMQTKEDIISKSKQLGEETTLNYEILRSIYKEFYQELNNLPKEDYLNINLLLKLQNVSNVPKIKELVNDSVTKGLKEIKETIDRLNEEKDKHLKLKKSKQSFMNYAEMKIVNTLSEHSSYVTCLTQLEDSKLVSGSSDNSIKMWDPQNNFKCVKTLSGHNSYVNCLLQLEDGKLASGSSDNTIRLWNTENNTCLKTLIGHSNTIYCLAQLDDDKLASGSSDHTIKLWDPQTSNKCIQTLNGHTNSVSCLIRLDDGKLASGSFDNTIKIWDWESNYSCVKTLTGHTSYVNCLIQLDNGKLASGSSDNSIQMWDPQNGFVCFKTLSGHTNSVYCLYQLEDGKLASSSGDKTIKFWDTENSTASIKTLTGHTNSINSLFQLDDGKLASGSSDNTIRIWA